MIVKELFNSNDKKTGYAIMWKQKSNEYADSRGWVWAVFDEDGKVKHKISEKGDGCKGCHSGGGNIDGTLMNFSFP